MGPGWRNLAHHTRLVRGQLWLRLDRAHDAEGVLRSVRHEAEVDGYRAVLVGAQSMLVAHGFAVGQWDDAVAEYDALLDVVAELGGRPAQFQIGAGARALVAVHRGDAEAAEAALALTGALTAPSMGALPALARALLLESSGAADDALASLLTAWDASVRSGASSSFLVLGPDLVRLAVAAGDGDRAGECCARVDAVLADNPPAASLRGTGLRCRGLLDGDPRLLVEAATVLKTAPRPFEHAVACEDAAGALAHAGDLPGARRWLDQALAAYERLDARWDASRATAGLRSAGIRRGSRAARARPRSGLPSLTSRPPS